MSSESAAQSLPDAVAAWLQTVADTVRNRNAAYGDSAIDPIRVFSRATSDEQLRVRIDDKLSRVARGAGPTPDTLVDLAGYIAILAVVQRRADDDAADQMSIPYIEDAPHPVSASDATALARPSQREPVSLSSRPVDAVDSHELSPQPIGPMMGVASIDDAMRRIGAVAGRRW